MSRRLRSSMSSNAAPASPATPGGLAAPRTTLSAAGVYNEILFYPKVRAIAGLRFDKHFAIFGGVGAAVEARIYDAGRDLSVSLMPDLFAGVEL